MCNACTAHAHPCVAGACPDTAAAWRTVLVLSGRSGPLDPPRYKTAATWRLSSSISQVDLAVWMLVRPSPSHTGPRVHIHAVPRKLRLVLDWPRFSGQPPLGTGKPLATGSLPCFFFHAVEKGGEMPFNTHWTVDRAQTSVGCSRPVTIAAQVFLKGVRTHARFFYLRNLCGSSLRTRLKQHCAVLSCAGAR